MRYVRRLQQEQGFTLLETLACLVVLTMTLLLYTSLWQGSQRLAAQATLQSQVARVAVTVLERWRATPSLAPGAGVRQFAIGGTEVHERWQVVPVEGLLQVEVRYDWQEGGHAHAQMWTTLHRG